jgi:hypothetical protein
MSLTNDQKTHFEELKSLMVNQIKTESAFTEQDKEDVLKLMNKNKEEDFYFFLSRNRPSARAVKLFLEGLTRRTNDRVSEADRAASNPASHNETFDKKVRAAIGYSMSESKDRVIKELKRLAKKSDATWKALGLNKSKTLKAYGIEE